MDTNASYSDLQDKVIIPLRAAGAKAAMDAAEGEPAEDDPVLVVHPNYVIE